MARRTGVVLKDEGLVSSVLRCLPLNEAKKLWNMNRLFYRVLDGQVVPLLALQERDWGIVSHYMDLPGSDGWREGHPHFEYTYANIAAEATMHQDFKGLQLLATHNYNFDTIRRDERFIRFAREALQGGFVEKLFVLRSIGFDHSEILAECIANNELSQRFLVNRVVSVDFLGSWLTYQCNGLDFATSDFIETQLNQLCGKRERLFRVPFVMAALMRAGASPCTFLRPDACGYLLVLALASESFNFVYLLVKEAVHLEAVFDRYRVQLQLMAARAVKHNRFAVLELMAYCGFKLQCDEEEQQQFDAVMLESMKGEDFLPMECLVNLGVSFCSFAERNPVDFHEFAQSRLEQPGVLVPHSLVSREVRLQSGAPSQPAHPSIRRLMKLDRRALELHFRSRVFLEFAGTLVGQRSFVLLQQIVQVHEQAMQPYFAQNWAALEYLLVNAFHTRDAALLVDMAQLAFPMQRFFNRQQTELDSVLLGWLRSKNWTELGMLKNEVLQSEFPAMFERNQEQSDAFVLRTIKDGYWFDFHNLQALSFDFPSFFHRRFAEVSELVLNFIEAPHPPHFVLLRELSALNFPWSRFTKVHQGKLSAVKDHDFLQFVISLEGFELGSQVYDIVAQTCSLYHSMAASMFDSKRQGPIEEDGALLGIAALQASSSSSSSSTSGRKWRSSTSAPSTSQASSSAPPPIRGVRTRKPSWFPGRRHCPPGFFDPGLTVDGDSMEPIVEDTEESQRKKVIDLVKKSQHKELEARKVVMLLICKGAYCWNPLSLNVNDVPKVPSTLPAASPSLPDVVGGRQLAFSKELRDRAWQHAAGVCDFLGEAGEVWIAMQQAVAAGALPGFGVPWGHHAANAPIGALLGAALAMGPVPGGAAAGAIGAPPPHPNILPWVGALAGAAMPNIGILPPIGMAPIGGVLQGLHHPAPAPAGNNSQPAVAFHVSCSAQPGELLFFRSNLDLFWDGLLDTILPLEP